MDALKPSPAITIIDLVDDEDNGESPQKENLQQLDSVKKRLNSETPAEGESKKRKTSNDDDDDDEVVCVEQPARFCQAVSSTNGDADIELVGTLNEQRLPHMRQHCTVKPFSPNKSSNMQFCDDCYCYVCDVPVQECSNWSLHKDGTNEGPDACAWTSARKAKQEQKSLLRTVAAFGSPQIPPPRVAPTFRGPTRRVAPRRRHFPFGTAASAPSFPLAAPPPRNFLRRPAEGTRTWNINLHGAAMQQKPRRRLGGMQRLLKRQGIETAERDC